MSDFLRDAQVITQAVAIVIDFFAMVIIASAAVRAFAQYLPTLLRKQQQQQVQEIRLNLGRSLVLGLEFLIGADILRSGVAPTWTNIGQLGAIVLLRTLLDYLIEREMRTIIKERQEGAGD